MSDTLSLISEISSRLGNSLILQIESTADGTLTIWVSSDRLKDLILFLKNGITRPFNMLYDLTAIAIWVPSSVHKAVELSGPF
jgi:NADH-quinone oxidoreductase subunit C/D